MRLLLVLIALTVSASTPATAAARYGVGWQCLPEFELLLVYATYTEENLPDGPNYSSQQPGKTGLVTTCTIGPNSITLHRTFTNTPRATGVCGGAEWSEYELHHDGVIVASFHLGCVDAIVRGHYGVLSICPDGDDTCRTGHWEHLNGGPLRSSLLGRWYDDP